MIQFTIQPDIDFLENNSLGKIAYLLINKGIFNFEVKLTYLLFTVNAYNFKELKEKLIEILKDEKFKITTI